LIGVEDQSYIKPRTKIPKSFFMQKFYYISTGAARETRTSRVTAFIA